MVKCHYCSSGREWPNGLFEVAEVKLHYIKTPTCTISVHCVNMYRTFENVYRNLLKPLATFNTKKTKQKKKQWHMNISRHFMTKL